ncbi:MAG: acyl-CoA dehydrogenase family protein, partial [bacterium]
MYEMAVILEELSRGGNPGGLLIGLTAIFGGLGIQEHGTDEQKEIYLTRISDGDMQFCMGLTEPNAGVNLTQIETFAKQDGDEYVINGQKVYISGADHADAMLLITRTEEYDPDNPTQGITLFLVDEPSERNSIEMNPIELEVPWFETQYQIHFNDLRVSEDDILGLRDQGLYQLWDTLNTERIATAAGNVGTGLRAIDLGVEQANQRKVFEEPIGSHQSIQHPLAESYAELKAARNMTYEAAWKFDNGEECGEESNICKLLASNAAEDAASNAMQAHGGGGFAPENEVFPLWVNSRLFQTVPIPNELVKNFLAEHSLGLPKSYKSGF